MKSLIKNVLLIAVMVTGLVGYSSEGEINVITKELNSKVIQFKLQNYDGDLEVRVRDAHSYELYTENFSGDLYTKTYDLTTLPNGLYFIEFSGRTKVKTIPFRVRRHNVEFVYSDTKIYYKPVVSVKEKMVKITKLALDLEPLTIELYNSDNELIHEEVLEGKMDLKRSLNLKKLAKGDYNLILKSKGEVITKSITI